MATAAPGPADLLPGIERGLRRPDRPRLERQGERLGYVTRFDVEKDYLDQYDVQRARRRTIVAYWTPAEDFDEFQPADQGQEVPWATRS